jgi:hypothetical protein
MVISVYDLSHPFSNEAFLNEGHYLTEAPKQRKTQNKYVLSKRIFPILKVLFLCRDFVSPQYINRKHFTQIIGWNLWMFRRRRSHVWQQQLFHDLLLICVNL